MKLRNIILYLIFLFLTCCYMQLFASNTNPAVSNVAFTILGTTVTVTYDVADAEQTSVIIQMIVSENSGITWDYDYGIATGDIDTVNGIATFPTQKMINWNYSGSNTASMLIRIIANDKTADGNPCPGLERVYYEGGPNNDGGVGDMDYYNTIQIGGQCWLKENLNIGTIINSTTRGYQQTNNSIIEKYCYNNDETNCDIYGGLYEWAEAMQYIIKEGSKGICPDGWHIPKKTEHEILYTYTNHKAKHLVAIGQPTMVSYGYTPTNETGFTALLAGYRYNGGSFLSIESKGFFWSSTEVNWTAGDMCLEDTGDGYYSEDFGFSVRCLKD